MSLKLVRGGDNPSSEEFRIPASDTKGHSARQWFRCIPAMARQVEQVLQSKTFPYRTKGDLFRHALHRHMNWLAQTGEVPSVSGQVDVILEIMRDEETNNDFNQVFEHMERRIGQHVNNGAKGEAIRLVLIVKNHIDQMPEGYWRDQYRGQLMKKYGKLIKEGNKANLGQMD